MVGDCLQGELSRHLLWESVSVREIHGVKCGSDSWGKKSRIKTTMEFAALQLSTS